MDWKKKENESIPDSLKGYFLISESNMSDPNFFQTVVLIIEHNKEGAFGLVVNRKSRLLLSNAIPELKEQQAAQCKIHVGGPVQQEYLFVLHSEMPDKHVRSDACSEVVEQVEFEPAFSFVQTYFKDDFLRSIPADDHPAIQLFLGYSGWGAGQLETELKSGSWIIHKASKKIVFHSNPEQGWKEALRQKGGIYKIFADANPNPSLN